MNDERVLEGIVTEFLLSTCRLRSQLTPPAVQAAMVCVHTAAQHPDDEAEADVNPLTTGSVAEFYVEPMLPHIGDVDVMYHWSTQLVTVSVVDVLVVLPAECSRETSRRYHQYAATSVRCRIQQRFLLSPE